MYSGILFTLEKEGYPTVSNHMEEPGGQYTKWVKPDAWEEISLHLTYTWNLKKISQSCSNGE